MNRLALLAIITTVAVTSLSAVASAHVTLQPNEVPAGAFKRLDVRVPNERDNASTKKVQVKFPAGFISVSYQPVAGWKTKVKMAKLAKPVEVFGEKHDEQVDSVTFTSTGNGIEPGQFEDFGLSVGLPDKAGATLTFKALQTYSNGEVVRWIGPPDADQPAPQVKLTAAPAAGGATGGADPDKPAASVAPASAAASDGSSSNTLSVIALIVGVLGLAAGVAGLTLARRARDATTA